MVEYKIIVKEKFHYFQQKMDCPMFTKEDIMVFGRSQNSSCGVPFREIYLGRIFEKKLDLKTKATLFTMKNNFEFIQVFTQKNEVVNEGLRTL